VEYTELMMSGVHEVPESQFRAFREIEKDNMRVVKAYNRRVKNKSFQVGDLVWKTILPLRTLR
jgi:hypothetical protein